MEHLIRSNNANIENPNGNAVLLDEEEFYYVKNPMKYNLDVTTCDTKVNRLSETEIKLIFNDPNANESQYHSVLHKAICLNKEAAKEWKDFQKHLNSANQGLDDTMEYYNTMLLQVINLSLGIVCLIGGGMVYAKELIPV